MWCARMRPEGLELAINTASDDSDIKYAEHVADLRNELNQRKQELGALREQQLQLMAKMEQVWVLVVNVFSANTLFIHRAPAKTLSPAPVHINTTTHTRLAVWTETTTRIEN